MTHGKDTPHHPHLDETTYLHDCKRCRWLGGYSAPDPDRPLNTEPIHTDLYYCPNGKELVARYSSDGPDYRSRAAVYDRRDKNIWEESNSHINEARKRAAEAGYIPPLTNYHPSDFLTAESDEWIQYHKKGLDQAALLTTDDETDEYHIIQLTNRFDITPEEAQQELTNWRNTKTGDNS
tara:strand:- start:6933 stop:7469 length:537 start_codon:yes stop_codon:yes gene_type:complete